MPVMPFLGQNAKFLNRWKQYAVQFPREDKWTIIYDTSWENENKINKIVTFSICPATVDLDELKQCLEKDLVTDIKSRSHHISEETIQFLKNNSLFFSISFVIKNLEDSLSLSEMQNLLLKMKTNVQDVKSKPERCRLRKLEDLIIYVNREKCDLKLLNKLFLISFLLPIILEFLTLFQNAKRVYWFPDREKEVFYKDKVLLDLVYLIYCDMMAKHHVLPLILRGCIAEQSGKKYLHDALIRYADYIAGILSSVDLGTGQGGSEKHQILWKHAICNNPRIVIFKIDAGALSNIPLTLPCDLDKRGV